MGGIALIDVQKEADLIYVRADKLFAAQWHCQYRIDVVHDQYAQTTNFFMDIQRKGHRERSIPLHTLQTTDLEILEQVIGALKIQTQLSLNFINFGHVRWPESQRWVR
ncbi:hypothetical protein FD07_GL001206 [Levilactobacillus parabrevis ATCC 53295]|uniref:Acetyl-CoA carboxylase n=1 Tax=Levilactobacillus parabrevis ATCC 53295 TaxID=1267003 RepID=A0A0R1H716_9LACO|nr:hypothetical protein FD07_GL001206 [Levilactobacillus parabrevis ATCC 53295]KRO07311.1 hypothetical protein IV61_GL000120 [Levilactobacillus parabrevis]